MTRSAAWLSFIIILAGSLFSAEAQTINAASCSSTDVQTALNSVTASTTTVNIPAGTCTWTAQVSLTVPSGSTTLSILGAGSLTTTGGGDVTVIVDGYASSNPPLVVTTAAASSFFRIAGITFEGGNDGGAGNTKWSGMLSLGGNSQGVRLDHSHFNATTYSVVENGAGVTVGGAIFGVGDHNIFDGNVAGVNNAVHVDQSGLYSGAGFGDESWANETSLGSSDFFFLEDNTFNNSFANDCTIGGRFVIRHNTLNSITLQTHPTGGGQRNRGCRAWEIYSNTFSGSGSTPVTNAIWISSGTGVVWGNSAPTGYTNFISGHDMRINNTTYTQLPTPNGWGYCGTAQTGTDSGWDENVNPGGYACLDQLGRGKGDLLTGNFPNTVDSVTGTITWPNQALEPIYEWQDTWAQVPGYPLGAIWSQADTAATANRDYYQYTTSFNGTSGTGSGLLAARPATCTKNVAYWATDTTTLYQCSSTNTWTAYYTPYTYPHPLTQGSGNPPAAPTGLTVSIQ